MTLVNWLTRTTKDDFCKWWPTRACNTLSSTVLYGGIRRGQQGSSNLPLLLNPPINQSCSTTPALTDGQTVAPSSLSPVMSPMLMSPPPMVLMVFDKTGTHLASSELGTEQLENQPPILAIHQNALSSLWPIAWYLLRSSNIQTSNDITCVRKDHTTM